MALQPQFAATPRIGFGTLQVANAGRDGTGTLVTCFTAGPAGSIVRRIVASAFYGTTPGMLRFWVTVPPDNTLLLVKEIRVPATSPSVTEEGFSLEASFEDEGLPLPAGALIRGATSKAEIFIVGVFGADL